MQKTTHKRFLSTLLSIAMVLGLFAAMPIQASAATVTVSVQSLAQLQTAITEANPSDTTIISVVSIPMTIEIESGQSVTLDGTGKNILIQKGLSGYLFAVREGGTLTLKNITLDGGENSDSTHLRGSRGGLVLVSGTLNLQDGAVLQNNYAGFSNTLTGEGAFYGGGALVDVNGTLNMYDGAVIQNCKVSPGGEIFGSYVSSGAAGGGVSVTGTFNMYGGQITGNRAAFGGGVSVSRQTYSDSSFKLGTFNMFGGEITSNYGRFPSGGTYVDYGGGVQVQGNFTLGGDAKILGNEGGNVHIPYAAHYDPCYITLGSGLYQPASGMDVGVLTREPNGVFVQSGANETIVSYFKADAQGEAVYLVDDQLILSDTDPTASAPVFTDNPTAASVTAGQSVTFTANATGLPLPNYYWQFSAPIGGGIYGPWTNIISTMMVSSNRYTLTATSDIDGRRYRCVATNIEGIVYSDPATLTVLPVGAPVFTTQPQTAYTVPGGSATFITAATASSGGAISYQWQGVGIINGNLLLSWTNLTNNENISGATSDTLAVSDITQAMLGVTKYRCVATNSNGSATSNSAGLVFGISSDTNTVITASEVNSFGTLEEGYPQPAPQVVTITKHGFMHAALVQPTSESFDLSAVSPTNLTELNATATFTVRPKAGLPAGTYDETIKIFGYFTGEGVSGGVYDLYATVDVSFTVAEVEVTNAAVPVIDVQPVSGKTTVGGAPVTLSVIAHSTDGGTLSYRWYLVSGGFGKDRPFGEDSATYTVPATAQAMGNYYVVVTNTNTSVNGTQTASVKSHVVSVIIEDAGYAVTVVSAGTGATGSGTYPQGAEVSISAGTPPAGMRFVEWTSIPADIIGDSSVSNNQFKMPDSEVSVTAVFEPIPARVTGVTVAPGTITLNKGAAYTFSATVAGENNPSQGVTWALTGGSFTTGINATSGELTIDAGETAATLTVTATSTADGTTSGSANVTVTDESQPAATVSGVTVAPGTITLGKGVAYTFSATVAGENNPSQGVTWALTGGSFTTGINATSGELTIDAGETATTLTVTATSTVDGTMYGSATVTVLQPVPTYSLTVSAGTGGMAAGNTTGSYAENTAISVTAIPASGYRFDCWSYTGITSFNSTDPIAGFAMPAVAVTLTANFVADTQANYVTFSAAQMGGVSGLADSTYIVIMFDTPVAGLTIDKIGILNVTGAAAKGAVIGSGASWMIELADVTAEGTVSVSVGDFGDFIVSTHAQTVTVFIEDATPPSLSGGSVSRSSDTAATIGFGTNEAGTAYYLVLASGYSAPSNTAVKAGTPLGAVTVGANTGKAVTLTAGAKDIYVVVEDAAGNISAPLKIAVSAYNLGGGSGTPSNTSGSFYNNISTFKIGSALDLVYIVQKDFSLFQKVKVDGAILVRNTDYKAESSSTRITLFDSYLDTLSVGTHTLVVGFTDGTSATAIFTVKEEAPPALAGNPFSDVYSTDWFVNNVIYVYENGLMNGTSTNPMLFSPTANLTRGMIVTILYRLENEPNLSGLGNPFDDVAAGMYYADAVRWAANNEIVTGYGDGKFGPEYNITRQDLAIILMRYMVFKEINIPVTQQYILFADESDIAGYAMDAIQTFNKLSIINGTGTNNAGQIIINPKGNATRAEAAAMLHRFLGAIA